MSRRYQLHPALQQRIALAVVRMHTVKKEELQKGKVPLQ
jgi:hypothetical protein